MVTLFRVLANPERYAAAVISGAPLTPIPELLDLNTTMNLDVRGLSADPFYLDCIDNDPLAFTTADSRTLTRELDRAWDSFGRELPELTVPTLAVHGEIDPIAAPGRYAPTPSRFRCCGSPSFPGVATTCSMT